MTSISREDVVPIDENLVCNTFMTRCERLKAKGDKLAKRGAYAGALAEYEALINLFQSPNMDMQYDNDFFKKGAACRRCIVCSLALTHSRAAIALHAANRFVVAPRARAVAVVTTEKCACHGIPPSECTTPPALGSDVLDMLARVYGNLSLCHVSLSIRLRRAARAAAWWAAVELRTHVE